MNPTRYQYDVIVIGAGHAGTEAAAAAARLGAKTALLTTNLDTVGQMSCNPAIGGVAKGQIVREVDALGGLMGQAIDATGIQFRMLNRRKGPAMHSPRAQADKKAYQQHIKLQIEIQPNLDLRQETVADLITQTSGSATQRSGSTTRIVGVRVRGDAEYHAPTVVLTTGTFLKAIMHTGDAQTDGGRAGEGTTAGISGALDRLGFQVERFKTGTPPRLNARTIDFSKFEPQPGDDDPQPFSFLTDALECEQIPCYIGYTNERVHDLIRANLDRAPMYSGKINSRGPRYCPSIEDKVVRFADKTGHQLFLEPEGRETREVYVNGISTSLPRDVQDQMFPMIAGLENATIMRYGYAVEYDFCPPTQLWPHLESKSVEGLFFAGQINGTTGYEEAAGQGLIAGLNAARKVASREPWVPSRDQAYIGVLVDDLVTAGTDEPYRMFTSRAEYRLLLRQDNADRRLTPVADELGLIDAQRRNRYQLKIGEIERAVELLTSARIEHVPGDVYLRRPEVDWDQMCQHVSGLEVIEPSAAQQCLFDFKYQGYIARQQMEVERSQRLAGKRIPAAFDYSTIGPLRNEAREKLTKVRPLNLGQAKRISGITPADLALVLAHLESSTKTGRKE
jgi:tRNA uridine 5-carboxymethylaminomethyl modification enzyme